MGGKSSAYHCIMDDSGSFVTLFYVYLVISVCLNYVRNFLGKFKLFFIYYRYVAFCHLSLWPWGDISFPIINSTDTIEHLPSPCTILGATDIERYKLI